MHGRSESQLTRYNNIYVIIQQLVETFLVFICFVSAKMLHTHSTVGKTPHDNIIIVRGDEFWKDNRTWLRTYSRTIVIFKENSNGEGADLVLGTGGEGRVDGADNAQSLHDEGEHLWAELGSKLDQSLEDAGEEGLEDVGALRQLQLIAVPGESHGLFASIKRL